MNKLFYIFPILLVTLLSVTAQENPWPVPDDQASITAPSLFTDEMRKAGEETYLKNCKSCHGDIGQNNMIKLNPLPKDLSTIGNQSDGSIYYKIKEGRGAMPTFKNTLSVADKWNVIAYIRSFYKDYVQPLPSTAATFGGSAVMLAMHYLPETKKIQIKAIGINKSDTSPAEGVEIVIFAERYFGNLKIADNKSTNALGIVTFDFPENLPANREGEMHLIAKVADSEKYGEVSAVLNVKNGTPNTNPGLTEQRAMWNVVTKAPWWITISYPLAVLGALATLGYILMLLRKIYLIGKENNS